MKGQCDWVTRNGTDGYLCCGEAADHAGQHRTVSEVHTGYVPTPSVYSWWFPKREWERNFGEAARNCYQQPRWNG